MGRPASAQHKMCQRSNGVELGFEFGFRIGNGTLTGEDTDTSVDSAPRTARPPRPRIHPRTASRSPSSTEYSESRLEYRGKPNEYSVTTRTQSCAEHRQSSCRRLTTADKTPIIHDDDNTDNSRICICNYGILRSPHRAS